MTETDARPGTDGQSGTDARSGADARPGTDSTTTRAGLRDRLKPLLLVGVGGFAGAVLRYAVAVALPESLGLPESFPWATLAVNVAGSFALGAVLFEERLVGRLGQEVRLLVATGFLSSFTTYSTFAAETAALSPTLATANVGANYVLGFAAVLAGRLAVRSLAAPGVTG